MRISIIIPAHNEETHLKTCLQSIVNQTRTPDELLVVDDNSTDRTFAIATKFSEAHPWIHVVNHHSTDAHIPGKKVVDAFNFGLQQLSGYELLGKFDADLMLPPNYFEMMHNHFQADWKLGLSSGVLLVEKNGQWVYENIADKNHVRGPIKLYHKACFEKIGGLRPGTGWDTVDVLLAQYHGFHVKTDESLKVKHLRATGHGYSSKNYYAKGEALYKMRYGLPLAKIALLKMAVQAKSPLLYIDGAFGYLNAWLGHKSRFVTREEGRFIRKFRWKGIWSKLG